MDTISRSLKVAVTYGRHAELMMFLAFTVIYSLLAFLVLWFFLMESTAFREWITAPGPEYGMVLMMTISAPISILAFMASLRFRVTMRNRLLHKILQSSEFGYTNVQLRRNRLTALRYNGTAVEATVVSVKNELIWDRVRETLLLIPIE